jgi:Mn-dependent DtxR family transcriptional regulator
MGAQISESGENYLEAIFLLGNEKKVIRVNEISRKMQVSMPSVHTALHLLAGQGLITHEHYGYVELTSKGRAAAQRIYASHTKLVAFFSGVLGVPPDIAERDACRIEHVISPQTLKRMTAFAKKHLATSQSREIDDESEPTR